MNSLTQDTNTYISVPPRASEKPQAVRPGFFRRFWEGWKRFGRKMGDFQARVILVLFYFLIMMPFALLLRLFSDPLAIKSRQEPKWKDRPASSGTPLEKALRQF